MRELGRLTISIAVMVVLALAIGACGEDSDDPTAPTATERRQADEPKPEKSREQKPGAAEEPAAEGNDNEQRKGSSTARSHDDSGGGVAQFRVPGGDNSVQDFGSEGSEDELQKAAAALHGFLDARVEGDWKTVCEHLADSVVKSLEQLGSQSPEAKGKGCPELMAALSGSVPRAARAEAAVADVGALRVEDERAFLLYHGARDTTYAIPMAKDEGRWKVASLAGVPLS